MSISYTDLTVFISSPGDVSEERKYVYNAISNLERNAIFANRLTTTPVAWDSGGGAPLNARECPQEAINNGMLKPSQCDIVVVILWSRMGTPLSEDCLYDGEHYLSGTHWEYRDAMRAGKLPGKPYAPYVLVYRRLSKIELDPTDEHLAHHLEQLQNLQTFFKTFENPDRTLRGSYATYKTSDEFRSLLNNNLINYAARILNGERK